MDLAILGLLQGQDLHGYEIRRQLRDRLGLWANVSFGSLYPALARLERSGAVETVAAPAPSSPSTPPPPPTGSLSGEWAVFRARRRDPSQRRRSRKVYRTTEKGKQLFAELLAGDSGAEDARSFALHWTFARHLAPPGRTALLNRRRDQLQRRQGGIRAALADPGLDLYARSAVEHAAQTLDHDIAWIDQLLQAEELANPRAPVGLHTSRATTPSDHNHDKEPT